MSQILDKVFDLAKFVAPFIESFLYVSAIVIFWLFIL